MSPKKVSLIIIIVLLVLFVISAITMATFKSISRVKIVDRSILVVDLERSYPENASMQFDFFSMSRKMSFYKLLRSIYSAANDDDVDAIILKGYSINGLSKVWELSQALNYFHNQHKPIYGYFESAGLGNLMLSSICDTVIMPPLANWYIPGFGANLLFLKGTFEKLGIGFDVIQFGKYKNAAEMFANDSMSVWMRESYDKLLDDLFYRFTSDCAQNLDIPEDSVLALIDRAIIKANDAVKTGLVDTIMYWQDFKKHLVGDEDERIVSMGKYSRRSPKWDEANRTIVLVIAEGNITDVESYWGESGITPDRYAKALRKAADDDDIDAIVFRVNSPGGSALASDIIYREVLRASERKPVIVSMANVAASGGYYISMAADEIVATPYTITGSIGVIMFKVHFDEMYRKIGANPQKLKRGKFADIFYGDHPMTPEEREILENAIGGIYEQFVAKAAEGRDTTYEWIDSVAQGRVWAATSAESLALVDTLGSLWDAIAIAEQKIGVPDGQHAKITIRPKPMNFFEVMRKFSETFIKSLVPKILRENIENYETIEKLSNKPLYLWTGKVNMR
ncbi:signal peptide peptidase SppA [bacterium]|nr:signal peptide peptidase SppA [bacterium]